MGLVKARRWWWWWCVEKRKNTFHTVTIFSNKSFQFFLSWKDFVLLRAPLSLIIMLIYSAFCLRILEQSWNQNNKSWMVAKIKATICFCVWKSSSNFLVCNLAAGCEHVCECDLGPWQTTGNPQWHLLIAWLLEMEWSAPPDVLKEENKRRMSRRRRQKLYWGSTRSQECYICCIIESQQLLEFTDKGGSSVRSIIYPTSCSN